MYICHLFVCRTNHAIRIFKTNLEYLGLSSLKEVKNGGVAIILNSNLCYVNNTDWLSITQGRQSVLLIRNKNETQCGMQVYYSCNGDMGVISRYILIILLLLLPNFVVDCTLL